MVAKRIYEIGDAATLSDDLKLPLDALGLPQAVQTSLAALRAWIDAEVGSQLSASLLATVTALDAGASTSITPNSLQGVLIVFDRDTPGRLAIFQYQVGEAAFIEPVTVSSVGGVDEWNPVVGAPPVVVNQIGIGVSVTGSITFSNGFAAPLNLIVTPGRAAILGELTIANLDQIPLLAPTSRSTVVMEDQGQGLRTSLGDFALYVDRSYRSAPAMPTTGLYQAGDFVGNGAPVVAGATGSKYVVTGWKRLTSGASHVLNTDWVECRASTGT